MNLSKLILRQKKSLVFISLLFCVSSLILIPFWKHETEYLDQISDFRSNGAGIDIGINYSAKMGTSWAILNSSNSFQVNPKYQSKLNISSYIFYFVDIGIKINSIFHIVRFISLPQPITELNKLFPGLFESKNSTELFPEDFDFYFFHSENSSIFNPIDSHNKTQFSINGLSLNNESITVEGVGGNYLINSLDSEYQRLFSLEYYFPGVFDEIAPIQDFIFLSQDKMFDLFRDYTLPIYGVLLLNFGIESFNILQLGILRQLDSMVVEDLIYDQNSERMEFIKSEGIIYYFTVNKGYLTYYFAELMIFTGLFLIFVSIIAYDIIFRYLDSHETLFIRLKKYGVNIVPFGDGVEKKFVIKLLIEIWKILIIFIIGLSILLSFVLINDFSLLFEGFFYFGIRLLMYFSFLTLVTIILFHQEYQKISTAIMFSTEKLNNIYSKLPVIEFFRNHAQMRWVIFLIIGFILCFVSKLIFSPLTPSQISKIKSIPEILLLDLFPIIFIITLSLGFGLIFSPKTKKFISKIGVYLSSLIIFRDKHKKKLILLWNKRNKQLNLPKSILLISIILLSFIGMIILQEKNYFVEKQIYVGKDIRMDIQYEENLIEPGDYLNLSKMPDNQISRAIICNGINQINQEPIRILWIENKNFFHDLTSSQANSFVTFDSGLVCRTSYYQSNSLDSILSFYINTSTHLIQQPIYGHYSEFPGAFCRLKQYQNIDVVWWTNNTLEGFKSLYNPDITDIVFYIKLENNSLSSSHEENFELVQSWLLNEIVEKNVRMEIDFKNYQNIENPLAIFDGYQKYFIISSLVILIFVFFRYKDDTNEVFKKDTLSILNKYGYPCSSLKLIKNFQNIVDFISILIISFSISTITIVLGYFFISANYFFN